MNRATDVSGRTGTARHGPSGPTLTRGRSKHVIAVLVVPDSVPLELLVTHTVFGPPIKAVADIMGIACDSPYEVVLCGETRRLRLTGDVDMGELAPLETLAEADTVLVPGIAEPLLVGAPHRSGGQRSSSRTRCGWAAHRSSNREIAAHAHLSERTPVRKFRAATGASVLEWVTRECMNRAKVLLEATDFPAGEVAAMSGFGSTG